MAASCWDVMAAKKSVEAEPGLNYVQLSWVNSPARCGLKQMLIMVLAGGGREGGGNAAGDTAVIILRA